MHFIKCITSLPVWCMRLLCYINCNLCVVKVDVCFKEGSMKAKCYIHFLQITESISLYQDKLSKVGNIIFEHVYAVCMHI